ncbi:putative bifunctional diguanylate cyclase/phosphodiesterase [Oxalobacteraceae bacterium A2-2]
MAEGADEADMETAPMLSAHTEALYERSCDAMLILRDGRVLAANPAALALFGCGAAELLGRPLADFSPLNQAGMLSAPLAAVHAALAARDGNGRHEWRYVALDGRVFWAEVTLTALGGPLLFAVLRDISARKEAELHLALAAQVFEHSREAIVLADRDRRIVAVNRAHGAITGHTPAEVLGQSLMQYRLGIEDETLYRQAWADAALHGNWQGEAWAVRRGGERYPAWLALAAITAGDGGSYMLTLSDIGDRKRSEAHTRHLAEHDFLTDLPNRVLLLDRLSLALTAARRRNSMLAILFLDLDRFKGINDSLGHHVGDLLLQEVAARLVRCVRAVDTVSRQGGDEFVIILADIGGIGQAAHVAATVLQAIAQEFVLDGHRLQVSTSIGVSIYPNDGADIDTLMKNADLAMYHAKQGGRNGFQFFNPEMHAQIERRAGFENELRQALQRHEFTLDYQAELDLASGLTMGAEVLLRWRHPVHGLLLPERFMAQAEEGGLMVAIGDWVLRQACQVARRRQQAGMPLVVAVNLSPAQLLHKGLVDSVRGALADSGLAPALLELEITEASLMKQGGAALSNLHALHALGVHLTMDDFGTGYTRLGQLKDYPVNKLKIDRSFIAQLDSGGPGRIGSEAMVGALIALARSLGLTVVAEGVETARQLAVLRRLGCQRYQGRHAAQAAPQALQGLAGG